MFLSNVGCHVSFGENAATWVIDLAYIKKQPYDVSITTRSGNLSKKSRIFEKTSNCLPTSRRSGVMVPWSLGVLFYFPNFSFSQPRSRSSIIYIYMYMHISTQHVCVSKLTFKNRANPIQVAAEEVSTPCPRYKLGWEWGTWRIIPVSK